MYSYEILKSEGLVILKSIGQSNIEDFQQFGPNFFGDVESQNIRRILLDWREFQGWRSEGAPSIIFHSWLEGRPLFDRFAIVFHDGVRNEADRFVEIFRNAGKDVRQFRPENYGAALDWLKAGNGESRPG